MRYPFDKQYSVTSTFQDHLNAGGDRARLPGTDFATPIGTPIHAVEDGNISMKTDQWGALYIYHDVPGVRGWYYVHLSKFNGSSRFVREGEVIGWSGNSGNSTGAHTHIMLHTGGRFVDPLPFLTNSVITNTNMETVTVQAGWGLSHVAQAAGLPTTTATYEKIYSLNQGHRGSWDWQSLNARMGAGDVLRVKEVSIIADNSELQALKDQIAKLTSDYEGKVKKLNEDFTKALQNQKSLDELQYAELKEDILDKVTKIKELEDKLKQYSLPSVNMNGVDLISQAIEEEAGEKIDGLLNKYKNKVDQTFKGKTLRSILGYDIFVVIGWVLANVSLRVLFPEWSELAINSLSTIIGIMYKLLTTRYDTNKDGKLDLQDTLVLKDYDQS